MKFKRVVVEDAGSFEAGREQALDERTCSRSDDNRQKRRVRHQPEADRERSERRRSEKPGGRAFQRHRP